jgi:CxxC motif-containing protein
MVINMKTREMTCINCPLGCQMRVSVDGETITVTGNSCRRGDTYARKEVTHPTRIVTSSVSVLGGEFPMVSVKTKSDIPKEKIFAVMKEIHHTRAAAPIEIGDILIENCAGTGVDVVATRAIKAVDEN